MHSNRTVFYLEETENKSVYLHIFCPKLNTLGTWVKHFAIWNARSERFVPTITEKRVGGACNHPLDEAKLQVAWAYRWLMSTVEEGTMTGVEVKLMQALQSKYSFSMGFIAAGHGNLVLSNNDKLVSSCMLVDLPTVEGQICIPEYGEQISNG